MEFVTSNWYVMCWAAKWAGGKEVYHSAINGRSENDKKVMKDLWRLFNEADVVVAHNAVKFDCRRVNTRFIANKIPPPAPYKIVDTLLQARKHFSFTSNRLNDLGKFLGLGEKIDTGGFKLWKQCMNGHKQSWAKMVEYCRRDVVLLEAVYNKLLPYITHPSINQSGGCPKCGGQVQARGWAYTKAGKYQRVQCKKCGSWGRSRTGEISKEAIVGI